MITKYLKAKDDSDQLRRALNNLIRQELGVGYKSVVAVWPSDLDMAHFQL